MLIEPEMGLPGHHLVEIKSTQIDVKPGKHHTSFENHLLHLTSVTAFDFCSLFLVKNVHLIYMSTEQMKNVLFIVGFFCSTV